MNCAKSIDRQGACSLRTLSKLAASIGMMVVVGCGPASSRTGNQFAEGQPFQGEPEEVWSRRLRPESGGRTTGEIIDVQDGSAEYSLDGGSTWNRVGAGTKLTERMLLRTDSRGSLDLFARESGAALRLEAKSFVRIVRLGEENTGLEKALELMIELERGIISGNFRGRGSSILLVRTHRGIVQPSGAYEIEAEGVVRADGGQVFASEQITKLAPGQALSF